jgi:hypothetical protein
MKKSPLHIVVYSNKERIGSMDTPAFMKAVNAPSTMFVAEAVKVWNAYKEAQGEPERASLELRK